MTLWVQNSTISKNSSDVNGGGIYNLFEASIYNSTITANTASADFLLPAGDGGGIYATETALTYFRNTILFGNHHRQLMDWVDDDCYGSLATGEYNLVGTLTGCFLYDHLGHDLIGVDPLLGELADNSGPTQTYTLLEGSPAIDGGNPAGCMGVEDILLDVDQRGAPRPLDGDRNGTTICDIGAYELTNYPTVYLPIIVR
jgi:hypothetical protein